ncbi:MAG: PilZ domain-containing protein [Gammaproteobacteria bacterium]|nr:MAG: PilZ domain-containing protein [Gammaproteobacteria bacterium]
MEHRLGTRRPVATAVTLHPPGGIPVAGRIREVSISGMFVETPPELFSGNTVIGVELTLPGSTDLRTYRWQAMVIRKASSGLGLMFDRLRPPAITRLLERLDAGLPSSSDLVADKAIRKQRAAGGATSSRW